MSGFAPEADTAGQILWVLTLVGADVQAKKALPPMAQKLSGKATGDARLLPMEPRLNSTSEICERVLTLQEPVNWLFRLPAAQEFAPVVVRRDCRFHAASFE